MRIRTAAVISVLLSTALRAQYPLVRTMTAMDGQQGVQADCLAEDAQGLVWLGGARGLFRTDGDRTEPILRTENDAMLALCPAPQGVVAALSSGVILRCGGSGCDTLWSDTSYRAAPVRSLVMDDRGGIWAGTYGAGTHLWREGTITRLSTGTGLNDDHVNAQCALANGHVVIATDQGIAVADPDGRVIAIFGEKEGATDNLVLAVTTDPDGRVWAGTDRGGVFSFDPLHPQRGARPVDSTWVDGAINRLIATRERLWLGVQGHGTVVCDLSEGLAYYHPSTDDQGSRSEVSAMLLDHDGAVWWCDGSSSLRRADPDVLITRVHEGVDMRNITALARAQGPRIAFADKQSVFTHAITFREDQRMRRTPLPIDSVTRIVSLNMGSDGILWAGTLGRGVFRLAPQGSAVRFSGVTDPPNDNVLSIRSRGDELWLATLDGIYQMIGTATGKTDLVKPTMPGSGFTFDVLPLSDGAVLVATDGNGVIRIDRDGSARTLPGAGAGHRTFYSLCSDGQGNAWACGPATGLYRVEHDRLVALPADAGTVMNEVYALASFGERLFVFGDAGAFLVDPVSGRSAEWTNSLGLRGAEAELNAVTTDENGALWVATDLGLYRLSPALAKRRPTLRAAITSVRQGADELPLGQHADLTAFRDFITFRFTGIHHDAPEDLRFAYRLIGTDTILRTTRDRELTFSHLPPGTYRFEVLAFIGQSPLGATPDTFAFTIAAPWWQRPWAILSGAVLLSLLLLLAIRSRDDRLRSRDRIAKAEAEMEREKVRFQMQVLRSQVNPHFLFNSFNTLIGLIEGAPEKAVEHVEHLSDFFREILQVRDKELIPLGEELRLVDTYFFLEQRRFGERIALRANASAAALNALVPPLTVQLLVENALKHNRATDDEPLVITMEASADALSVSHPFRPRDTAAVSTGFGINSIRQRFASITDRPVSFGQENGNFVARIPLIPAAHEDPDR